MNCIIPGSFNPITNGHISLIKKAAKIFDTVIVLGCENIEKRQSRELAPGLRDSNEAAFLTEVLKLEGIKNAEVAWTTGLVSDFPVAGENIAIVRGIRNGKDYDYEEELAKIYVELNSHLEVVWLRPDPSVSFVSSSLIRELIKNGKWAQVEKYVPELVYVTLRGVREWK